MSQDDTIFREVDEELRREQMAALWKKYGTYVLIGAVAIVAIVGGYNIYTWWSAKQAAENGQQLYSAIELVTQDKNTEALQAFTDLAGNTSGGYQTLANLERAAIHAQEGRNDEAVALYDQVAASRADELLRNFATLQAGMLRVDEADEAEIRGRVSGLIDDTNPWRYSARELLALAAFRSGNTSESEKIYGQILGDPSSPADMRRRAEAMLALMFKAPEASGAAPEGGESSPTQ